MADTGKDLLDYEYDLDDHPYSSPSEDSERDEDLVDMDFTEYDGCDHNDVENDEHHQISADEPDRGVDLEPNEQGLPRWCSCENCTITSSEIEAVCCNDRPEIMELLPEPGHCVTHLDFFRQQLMSDDSLTYRLILASTIKSETARQQYLSKEFTNRLKRHLAYRTYLIIVNNSCPLGRYNRVVIPRCVVSKIREKYPEVSDSLYTGFLDVQNNAAQSASSTTE